MCPAFTISKSKRNLFSLKTGIPGPGMYTTDSFIKFTVKKNENNINANPLENSKNHNKTQNVQKDLKNGKNTPGPGAYNIKNSDFENKQSKKINSTFFKAGMNKNEEKSASFASFSRIKGTREDYIDQGLNNTNPGPGKYDLNVESRRNGGSKFSKGSKFTSYNKNTIGPGHYNIDKDKYNSSSGNIIFGKNECKSFFETSNTVPGPGKYLVNNNTSEKIKSAKIGTNPRRNDWEDKKPHLYPGPGNYSNSQTMIVKNGTKFSTTKRITIALDKSMPDCGPGKYNPNTSSFGSGSKFSIKGKLNYKNLTSSPGPAAYLVNSIQYTRSGTKPKFTTSKRSELFKSEATSPGPANYNLKEKQNLISYGFGKDKRLDIIKPKTPGPGQYSVNDNLVGKLPTYLIPKDEISIKKSK